MADDTNRLCATGRWRVFFFFCSFLFLFFSSFLPSFFFLDDDGVGQDAPVTGAPELNEAEPKATAAGPPQSNCPAL